MRVDQIKKMPSEDTAELVRAIGLMNAEQQAKVIQMSDLPQEKKDRMLDATLGRKFDNHRDLASRIGVRPEQMRMLLKMHGISMDDHDPATGEDMYYEETVERLLNMKEAGTLWSTGESQTELDEAAERKVTAIHPLQNVADDMGLPINKAKRAFEYARLEELDYRDGNLMLSPEQVDTLQYRQSKGKLFSEVGNQAPVEAPNVEA